MKGRLSGGGPVSSLSNVDVIDSSQDERAGCCAKVIRLEYLIRISALAANSSCLASGPPRRNGAQSTPLTEESHELRDLTSERFRAGRITPLIGFYDLFSALVESRHYNGMFVSRRSRGCLAHRGAAGAYKSVRQGFRGPEVT